MRTMIFPRSLQPLFTPAMSFLGRSDIAVHTGISQDDLMRLHFEHRARLIVTRPDLPGMSCERFVNVIRRNEVLRNVSILLLVQSGPDLARAKSCGANLTLPLSTPAPHLAGKVQELLAVPARRSYRVVLNMAVEGVRDNRPFMCNMENISSHGMLVRSAEKLSRGDRISCSFYLPDGRRVSAVGSIARVVDGADGASPHKYGVQFTSIGEADGSAITSFVDKEIERLQAGGLAKAS